MRSGDTHRRRPISLEHSNSDSTTNVNTSTNTTTNTTTNKGSNGDRAAIPSSIEIKKMNRIQLLKLAKEIKVDYTKCSNDLALMKALCKACTVLAMFAPNVAESTV